MIGPWCCACILIWAILAWVLPEQAIRWSETGHTGDVLCEGLSLSPRGDMIYDIFSNNTPDAPCTGPSCQQSPGTTIPLQLPSHIHVAASPVLPSSVQTNWGGGGGWRLLVINTAHLYTACLVIGTRERLVERLKTHEWQSSRSVGFSWWLASSAHLGLQQMVRVEGYVTPD